MKARKLELCETKKDNRAQISPARYLSIISNIWKQVVEIKNWQLRWQPGTNILPLYIFIIIIYKKAAIIS